MTLASSPVLVPNGAMLDKVILAIRRTVYMPDLVITAEMHFADDLGLDSLDVTEILLHVEEMFDTEIPADLVGRFETVGQVVRYLSRRMPPDFDRTGFAYAA